MTITEIPEKWVILKINSEYYKVFGTWAGSYLTGDRWKLNSGIKEVKEDEHYYYFIGYSGSCYKCLKTAYGTASSYGERILNSILEKSSGQAILMENQNWTEI